MTAAEQFARYLATRHFGSLDGIRCLCISAVIFHHSPLMPAWGQEAVLATRGFLGVDFFFVLSGYLITTLLLREERRTGRFSLTGFYRRRALRILPVYLLVITAVGVYYALIKADPVAREIWIYYYLFLSNFLTDHIPTLSITWSLAVEEQYYLLWPLMLLAVPRRMIPAVLTALIALNVAIAAGLFAGTTPLRTAHLVFALPVATYAPILIGSLLGFALNTPAGFAVLMRVAGSGPAAWVALALLLAALIWLPADLRGWPNLVIHLLMAGLLTCVVVREDNALAGFLAWAPVCKVGQISYGLYLYHLIALDVVLRLIPAAQGGLVFPLYFGLSVVIAWLSFRYFETPFLRLRHPAKARAA